MSRAGKRKLPSVASVEGKSSSVVTEIESGTQKKRCKQSPRTSSTKNVKKKVSAQSPSTSGEGRTPSVNTSTGYECPICWESTRKNEMKSLQCYHAFHQTCIDPWLIENRSCPVCRQETEPPQNARPPLNNQRVTFGGSQALPEMGFVRNNVRIISGEGRTPSVNTSTGYECPICLESTRRNEMKSLQCYHAFHQRCIDSWLIENSSCPVCREETEPPQNARPPLNNQRVTFSGSQALPEMGFVRNNVRTNNGGINRRRNNGGISMSRNNGGFMSINSNGIVMSGNNGSFVNINGNGIHMSRNNGNFVSINSNGIDMSRNNGGFMSINNNGIDMSRNNGGFITINRNGIDMRLNNGDITILNNADITILNNGGVTISNIHL